MTTIDTLEDRPVAQIPSRAEHQRRFAALETADRRAIIRAVNRGRAVEVRKHAPLAIGVARRQQRFWRWAWALGPAIAILQATFVPIDVAMFNGLIATSGLILVSWFWHRRAVRSERLNLEVVEGRRAPGSDAPSPRGGAAGAHPGGHLPGERPQGRRAARDAAGGDGNGDSDGASGRPHPQPIQPGMRPYRPRGRKRRSKR